MEHHATFSHAKNNRLRKHPDFSSVEKWFQGLFSERKGAFFCQAGAFIYFGLLYFGVYKAIQIRLIDVGLCA